MKELPMISPDDWRLQGQEWLREELLRFKSYLPPKPGFEHDHCEFCWLPFRSEPHAGVANEGYVTGDKRWICETCYEDFKLLFDWVLEI